MKNNNQKYKYKFIKNNKILIICVFIASFIIFSVMFWFLYESLELTSSGVKESELFTIEEVKKSYFERKDYDDAPLYVSEGEGVNTKLVPTTAYLKKSDYNDEIFYERIETPLGTDLVKNEAYIRKSEFNNYDATYGEGTGKNTTFVSYKKKYTKKEDLNDNVLYQNVQKEGDFNRWEGKDDEYLEKSSLTANLLLREGTGNNTKLIDADKTLYLKTDIDSNLKRHYITPAPTDGVNGIIANLSFFDYTNSDNYAIEINTSRFAIYDDKDVSGVENQSKGTFSLNRGESKVFYIIAPGRVKGSDADSVFSYEVNGSKFDFWRSFLFKLRFVVTRNNDDTIGMRFTSLLNTFLSVSKRWGANSSTFDRSVFHDMYEDSPFEPRGWGADQYLRLTSNSTPQQLGWFQTYIEEFTKA